MAPKRALPTRSNKSGPEPNTVNGPSRRANNKAKATESIPNGSQALPNGKRRRAPSPNSSVRTKRLKHTPAQNQAPTQRLDIYVFGTNENGVLGLGPDVGPADITRPRLNPLLAADSVGVVQVAVGGMHCVALTHDNRILTWGVNDKGALGRDTAWDGGLVERREDGEEDSDHGEKINPKEATPGEVEMRDVPDGTVFTQVAAGDSASFALTREGDVYGWGTMLTSEAKEGFLPGIARQAMPMRVPSLPPIAKVVLGSNHVVALTSSGHVYTWGHSHEQGQLGRRVGPHCNRPVLVPQKLSLRNIVDIGTGADHSFAIRKHGLVFGWGANNFGQTGVESSAGLDSATVFTPEVIKSLKGLGTVKQISGGNKHTLALTDQGDCFAWGQYDTSATGIDPSHLPPVGVGVDARGKPRMLKRPTRIPGLKTMCVATGGDHSIAISTGDQAFSWGFNCNRQTGHKGDDDVQTPTLIQSQAVPGKSLIWAGAGGNFSLLAGVPRSKG